ncbi:hypothetical protein OBBRIDRAFT_472360 [Obba rivulosa]|uniref:BTB domain-containing protein n=1 Tax=Obba rivulosa TaxID=1052685 RepID=A0A8E2AXL6_9APHY|nr:hypothetical protein OBBRIDRAFT_472360 [Obba rivulosa]
MESAEWESVLQFVSDPLDLASPLVDKPVSECTTISGNPASQIPTPPASDEGSPAVEQSESNPIVSVSTTFYPGANLNPLPPDVIFLSSDGVFFYVHTHQILGVSNNGFKGLLPAKRSKLNDELGPVVPLDEPAAVINVMLHTIYNMSCAHYSPTTDTLVDGVDGLAKYGVSVKAHVAPGTSLYSLILSQAPVAPIELYALAGKHDLYDLAVPISSHLLAFALPMLSDEFADRMGPVYLKRLFFLHLGRIDALKRLLLPPPHPHAPTPKCDFTEQKKLTRAWALASAYLAWDARPDLSTRAMETALCPLGEHLSCEVCQKLLSERIKQLIIQWSVVKRTI